MKKSFFIALCALAFAFTGCSTYQYSARQSTIKRQDIQAAPTIVDVKADFNKRINVTSDWQKTKEDAMAECRYLAITGNNIDIVVDPIYKIERRKSNKFKASLTGFAGYYINSRTQYEDIQAVGKFSREDIEKYLILHNPEVLKYLNAQGEVVNVYHNNCPKMHGNCMPPAPAPAPEAAPAPEQPAKRKK